MGKSKLSYGDRIHFWKEDRCPRCPKVMTELSTDKAIAHYRSHVKKTKDWGKR